MVRFIQVKDKRTNKKRTVPVRPKKPPKPAMPPIMREKLTKLAMPQFMQDELSTLEAELKKADFPPWQRRLRGFIKGVKEGSKRFLRETKNDYYCTFPPDRYYLIRPDGKGGWYHLYPDRLGMLPDGYASKRTAERALKGMWADRNMKVVSSRTALKHPIPKRW